MGPDLDGDQRSKRDYKAGEFAWTTRVHGKFDTFGWEKGQGGGGKSRIKFAVNWAVKTGRDTPSKEARAE